MRAIRTPPSSMARRTALNGRTSLSAETTSRMGTQNSAFNTISRVAKVPLSGAGRKYSMVVCS